MRFLRRIRRWQVVTAVIVLLVVAIGAFVATQRSANQDTADIPEDQQVIPVRRGDLIQEITITSRSDPPVSSRR